MNIIVPMVTTKGFLYKIIISLKTSEETEFEVEKTPFDNLKNLFNHLYPNEKRKINITLSPIDGAPKTPEDLLHPNNLPSMTLGIFLAIEQELHHQNFKELYDGLIVTGSLKLETDGVFLDEISHEKEKYEAARNYSVKKNGCFKFLYTKSSDSINSDFKKNITVSRIAHNSKFEDLCSELFSPTAESFEYYEEWTDKNGLPFGINKISKEIVSNRLSSYRFEYSKKQLVRVVHINSKEFPHQMVGPADDPVIQEIESQTEDRILISCRNMFKNILFWKEYIKDEEGNFNRLNFWNATRTAPYTHIL